MHVLRIKMTSLLCPCNVILSPEHTWRHSWLILRLPVPPCCWNNNLNLCFIIQGRPSLHVVCCYNAGWRCRVNVNVNSSMVSLYRCPLSQLSMKSLVSVSRKLILAMIDRRLHWQWQNNIFMQFKYTFVKLLFAHWGTKNSWHYE